jgi:enamine deaminase RidA (YjgF/YER057c/UK114 family)
MTRRAFVVASIAAPAGAYSHAVLAGRTLHTAGLTGRDPETGAIVSGGAAREAERALRNIAAICDAAGSPAITRSSSPST